MIEKSVFQRYLDKYNLGGACESVLFTSQDGSLTTKAISDDKSVLVEVEAQGMGVPAGEYAIYETARLRSILNVLDERVNLDVESTSFEFSDSNNVARFVLSDPAIIPAVPSLKDLPEFDISIDLDETFVSTFIKAKSALPEVDTFTVVCEDEQVCIVLGFSSLNTNRVKMRTGVACQSFNPVSFSASYFKDILSANKDCKNGVLNVATAGLAVAKFSVDNMWSTYYLVKIDTID